MARETIIVDFDENGNPTIEVKGVKGTGCKALTEAIEKALGTVSSDENTREYYERPTQQNVAKH